MLELHPADPGSVPSFVHTVLSESRQVSKSSMYHSTHIQGNFRDKSLKAIETALVSTGLLIMKKNSKHTALTTCLSASNIQSSREVCLVDDTYTHLYKQLLSPTTIRERKTKQRKKFSSCSQMATAN